MRQLAIEEKAPRFGARDTAGPDGERHLWAAGAGGSRNALALISEPTARAKSGDARLPLVWNNLNDFDLRCQGPNGEVIRDANPGARSGLWCAGAAAVSISGPDNRRPTVRAPARCRVMRDGTF